jgi:hypothetical protein
MSLQRAEYFKDVAQDALSISQDPEVIAAFVLSDSLNGLRKALLEISENIRQGSEARSANAHNVDALIEIIERNLK